MIARIIGAITHAAQCFYCGAWFQTDVELAGHLSQCGYDKRK